jgi:hypothetical protein
MNKVEMMKSIAYVKVNVLGDLKKKSTKVAKEVVERIERSEYYQVFSNGSTFTINGRWHVTTNEINQIKKVLKQDYMRVSDVMDQYDMWVDWTKASNEEPAPTMEPVNNDLKLKSDRLRIMSRR